MSRPIQLMDLTNIDELNSDIKDLITQKVILPTNLIVIVFNASWCSPCQRMKKAIYSPPPSAPTMVSTTPPSLSQVYHNRVSFLYVDNDKCKELTEALGVTSLPTLHVGRFVAGKFQKYTNFSGADVKKLTTLLDQYLQQ